MSLKPKRFSLRNSEFDIVGGGGEGAFKTCKKNNFTAKFLNTFFAQSSSRTYYYAYLEDKIYQKIFAVQKFRMGQRKLNQIGNLEMVVVISAHLNLSISLETSSGY